MSTLGLIRGLLVLNVVLIVICKKDCPKWKNNNNWGNQAGNAEAQAKVYAVGNAGANPDNNVITDHDYNVELADGRIVGLNTVIQGYTLSLLNHPFNIDLIPVELGSFDVIIGMDWLAKYHAVITKTSQKKQLEDVPVVQEFPEVFLEDLPELRTKASKRPKFPHSWVAPVPVCKEKDGSFVLFFYFPDVQYDYRELNNTTVRTAYPQLPRIDGPNFIFDPAARVKYLFKDRSEVRVSPVEGSRRRHSQDYIQDSIRP
ncbi:putative reverse transcriptase domain-containing protein [Tanacetum coccineum]|uniref:Reverse transcriptase domain-containing protein n=1 Tax=Tanacetum coccineum TaxID=301880 RepID=A0ABQ5CG11_9ASTR